MRFFFLILYILAYCQAKAQEEEKYSFSLLRQGDNLSGFAEAQGGPPTNLYDRLKWIKLGEGTVLSFGGSARFQAEQFINEQFSKEIEEETDIWFLNRTMLHAHLKVRNNLEVFGELNSSLITSKKNLIPVDKDELSVNQLFVRYYLTEKLDVLVGRQNMRLGSGRLVDVREGPNVRLSFDMVQLTYTNERDKLNTFFAVPVRQREGVFDNDYLNYNETLTAIYYTRNWSNNNNTDIYILYKKEGEKTWNKGTEDDQRISLGLRHFGNWGRLNYNNEFVYQFGDFGPNTISAWTASFKMGIPFEWLGQSFEFSFNTEAISGDADEEDNRLNTFDGLYPRGAYFGRVARFGPSNLLDLHPSLEAKIGDFTFDIDYVAFWRFSRNDGIYGPPLILDYPALNDRRFIGHQIGTISAMEINQHIALEFETNIIFPGAFLVESGLDDKLFHAVFTAEFKF